MSTCVRHAASQSERGALRRRRDPVAGRLALAGGTLGMFAGVLQMAIGPSIADWAGDKQDTLTLGVTTVVLSGLAHAAAVSLSRASDAHSARRVGLALALILPALICFTTVGRLWYLPGALLLSSAGLVLAGTTRDEFAAAFDGRHWRAGLLATCGGCYVLLGGAALGFTGGVGILGGALIWSTAPTARRRPRVAHALLLAGAVPFAIATWWSVVTPPIAVLAILIGRGVIHEAFQPAA